MTSNANNTQVRTDVSAQDVSAQDCRNGCFGTMCRTSTIAETDVSALPRLQKRMFRHNVPKLFLAETSGSPWMISWLAIAGYCASILCFPREIAIGNSRWWTSQCYNNMDGYSWWKTGHIYEFPFHLGKLHIVWEVLLLGTLVPSCLVKLYK